MYNKGNNAVNMESKSIVKDKVMAAPANEWNYGGQQYMMMMYGKMLMARHRKEKNIWIHKAKKEALLNDMYV